jgi:hypothetical protein
MQITARMGVAWDVLQYRLGRSMFPPHTIKLRWIQYFGNACKVHTLVETGTYYGITVGAMLQRFEQIYTIELAAELSERAEKQFAGYPHVHVLPGNSAEVLPALLEVISEKCLFWLDGHYSGPGTARGSADSPIVGELSAIRKHPRNDHVILIDDARLFDGTNGYVTQQEAFSLLREINPRYTIRQRDDIIQAYC